MGGAADETPVACRDSATLWRGRRRHRVHVEGGARGKRRRKRTRPGSRVSAHFSANLIVARAACEKVAAAPHASSQAWQMRERSTATRTMRPRDVLQRLALVETASAKQSRPKCHPGCLSPILSEHAGINAEPSRARGQGCSVARDGVVLASSAPLWQAAGGGCALSTGRWPSPTPPRRPIAAHEGEPARKSSLFASISPALTIAALRIRVRSIAVVDRTQNPAKRTPSEESSMVARAHKGPLRLVLVPRRTAAVCRFVVRCGDARWPRSLRTRLSCQRHSVGGG